ncbi:MBL fold metallo-hydrolase, partial [Serratia marcescens]
MPVQGAVVGRKGRMKRINRYYDAAKAHHTPEGFRNPEP